MTCCIYIVINIRIATSASVGGVTLILTSRIINNSLVIVSCRGKSFCFNLSASAVTLLLALAVAGCFLGGRPLAEAVSCCVNIFVNIGVTTVTSICRVTLFGASRFGYNRFICVSCCEYSLGFNLPALTLTFLLAVGSTSSILSGRPFTKAMTCCIYIVINVRIATSASVGGVTLILASRISNNSLVIVSCCEYSLGFNLTASTLALLLAIIGASRLFGGSPITKAMSGGIYICVLVSVATVTRMHSVAFVLASRIGYNRGVGVSFCLYCTLFYLTTRAGSAFLTFFGTSRLGCYRPIAKLVNVRLGLIIARIRFLVCGLGILSWFRILSGFRGFCWG